MGDIALLRQFVEKPEDFTGHRETGNVLSAAQISQNPFGDYAPQSTQIQGILKSLHDSFEEKLEKMNTEEDEAVKSFKALMETKNTELDELEGQLESKTLDKSEQSKQLVSDRESLDDAQIELKKDKKFFSEAKETCKVRALAWEKRKKMHEMELQGIDKAIEILSSDDAKKTFDSAATTFLQVRRSDEVDATDRLRTLAAKYKSLSLARIVVAMKSGGHFDRVIGEIDKMITVLREEEQDDIKHRDRCQGSQNKNKNELDDLQYEVEKTDTKIQKEEGVEQNLKDKVKSIKKSIADTEDEMEAAKKNREEENKEFIKAVKDDADAIKLIEKAKAELSKFYRQNNIPLNFIEKGSPPPDASKFSGEYKGESGASGGIVATMDMIIEDIEKETKVAREEEQQALEDYEKERKAMSDAILSKKEALTNTERHLVDVQQKIEDLKQFKEQKEGDLSAEEEKKSALEKDCKWVETHFEERRTQRKAELDGLAEAKNYLAGVESGDAV